MPRPKFKNFSNLFRTAVKITSTPAAAANTVAVKPSNTVKLPAEGKTAAVKASRTPFRGETVKKKLKKPAVKTSLRKQVKGSVNHQGTAVGDLISRAINEGDSAKIVSQDISTILCGWELDEFSDTEVADAEEPGEDDSNLPWFSNLFNSSTPFRRKELARDRKNKWIFKNTQKHRFDKLVSMCLAKVGSGSTYQVLYKLGRGTGLKEYNAFIRGCIETARKSKNEKVQMEQILEAYRLLQLMKERGFPIEEETFGPFLMYLIDNHMEEQFTLLLEIVKDEDVSLHPRLGYYEMLFWIEMKNEVKIKELCEEIATGESEMGSLLHENYLLALCERDRKEELLPLLDIIDITRISSFDNLAVIFSSLGRLSLEAFAELFILVLKDCDCGSQGISNLIYFYSSGLNNITVEDVILKFKDMHKKLDLALVAKSYEKLVTFCCDSHKVYLALDLVDEMCEAGLNLSTEALNSICHACEENHEYVLVRRIYTMLCHHNLKPNVGTYRSIISLNVRMKDFDSAYSMLEDMKRVELKPSASLYNAILAGYYREKNMAGVARVLKQMKDADVKPDSQTFGYLIGNCTSEKGIVKYFEEMKLAGVQTTKQIYMALINGYAASGQFEKAKEVVLDKGIPVKNLNEIKSTLVAALASHGQIVDAVEIYKEMKQNGCCLEPKAVISLIEHHQAEGDLNLLLQLLEELEGLDDSYYWVDGCWRVIMLCIKNQNLRPAVDLLKKVSYEFQDNELAAESIFDGVFSHIAEMEPPNLQIGIDLLKAIKEELGHRLSRKCLDFLLSACVSDRDLQKAQLIWKEYDIADLPHNILSSLRMYQAYLASGHLKEAAKFLSTIPKDDAHVRCVIQACRVTYVNTEKTTTKKKKKKKKNKNTVEQEGVAGGISK